MTIPAFGRRLLPVLACGLLLSCGGDKTAGGGTDSPVAAYTYKGFVTRTQVKVCVDRNRDWVCNGGEPWTTSLSDGSYSLYLSQDVDRAHPVIAEVPARWSGGVLTPAHVLAAPAGKGKFIGPLSTMVQVALDSGMAVDLAAAEQLVAAQANRTKLYLPLSEAEGGFKPQAKSALAFKKQSTALLYKNYIGATSEPLLRLALFANTMMNAYTRNMDSSMAATTRARVLQSMVPVIGDLAAGVTIANPLFTAEEDDVWVPLFFMRARFGTHADKLHGVWQWNGEDRFVSFFPDGAYLLLDLRTSGYPSVRIGRYFADGTGVFMTPLMTDAFDDLFSDTHRLPLVLESATYAADTITAVHDDVDGDADLVLSRVKDADETLIGAWVSSASAGVTDYMLVLPGAEGFLRYAFYRVGAEGSRASGLELGIFKRNNALGMFDNLTEWLDENLDAGLLGSSSAGWYWQLSGDSLQLSRGVRVMPMVRLGSTSARGVVTPLHHAGLSRELRGKWVSPSFRYLFAVSLTQEFVLDAACKEVDASRGGLRDLYGHAALVRFHDGSFSWPYSLEGAEAFLPMPLKPKPSYCIPWLNGEA